MTSRLCHFPLCLSNGTQGSMLGNGFESLWRASVQKIIAAYVNCGVDYRHIANGH